MDVSSGEFHNMKKLSIPELLALKPKKIDFSIPTSICESCGKEYDLAVWLKPKPYQKAYKQICYDCWVKDLQNRKLSAVEIRYAAQDYIAERDKPNPYNMTVYLPSCYTKEQQEAIMAKVKELDDKAEKEREYKIRQKYIQKAQELLYEEGSDETLILARVLRLIDEKFDKAYNKVPLSEMRFC